MMLTIAGVASAAAILNAVYPAVARSTGALISASDKVDERLKSDIEIVHAIGELNASGAFADTNSNGRFEIFVWVKNVGSSRITSISESDTFFGQVGNFPRISHEVDLEGGQYPRWFYAVEGTSDDTEWNPRETMKITIDFNTDTQSAGTYDIKFIIPNGVSDEFFFSM